MSAQPAWLTRVVEHSRLRAQMLRELGLKYWRERMKRRPRVPAWSDHLGRSDGIHIIAEIKRRAPSVGHLHDTLDVEGIAEGYVRAGARAVSVLTEPLAFEGTLDDLARVARRVSVPVLRKDFLVDPLQVIEAACNGAAAVLVIGCIVDDATLRRIVEMARHAQVEVLYEAFERDEVARGFALGCTWIGLNNRDLKTLRVDPWHALRIYQQVVWPAGTNVVVESGIEDPDIIRAYEREGIRHFLVGTAFMRTKAPWTVLASWMRALETR